MELAPQRAATAPRSRRGVSWPVVAEAAAGAVGVASIAAGQGGYFPSAWGWFGMGACWAATLVLVLRRELVVSRLELAALGGAVALTTSTAASLVWTSSITLSTLEVERTLAYLAVFVSVLLVCQRRSTLALLAGVWVAITLVAAYALATHLLPERFGIYVDQTQSGRLFQPIGYWNALGIFCAMGIMLALGLIEWPGHTALRAGAGASLPVLTAATYFTFSRGAWLAAGVAFSCVVVVAPGRLRYITTTLVGVPIPAFAVVYCAGLGPLVASHATPAQIESPGGRAALAIGVATVAEAALVIAFACVERRVQPSTGLRRAYAGVLIAAVLVAVVGIIAVTGSPAKTARHLENQLTATPPNHTDLNHRLLSVSLTNRQYLWRVAWHEFENHPLAGGGAGTYATAWLEHRPLPQFVLDAHDLYLETLGELGLVGFVALAVLLIPPLVAAVRVRTSPVMPAALGVYVAFLVHASVDWDWEVPAVTVVALIVAGVLLVQARGASLVRLGVRLRWAAGVSLLIVAAVCGVGLAGNRALSAGSTALGDHRYHEALAYAGDAHRYAPWSDQPYIVSGRAQLDLHNRTAAARSFHAAVRKDPSDWVGWQWLARATTGPQHSSAMKRLLALDPRYDVVDGRP